MAYWICITNKENWDVIKNKLIWGVSDRHYKVIKRVKKGDKLLIYVISHRENNKIVPSQIVGVFEADSEVFRDETPIFVSPKGKTEVYPNRIKLKMIKIFDPPIEFKPLVPKLKFIVNKKKWAGSLQGRAMREIPEEDFNTIMSQGE